MKDSRVQVAGSALETGAAYIEPLVGAIYRFIHRCERNG